MDVIQMLNSNISNTKPWVLNFANLQSNFTQRKLLHKET